MFEKVKQGLRLLIREEVERATKANPVISFTHNRGDSGKSLPLISDPDVIAKAASIDAWAYVAFNTIGKNLTEAPLIAEESKVVDGELQWVALENGRLYELTQMPNEYESIDALLWRLTMSIMTGDGYLIRDLETENLYHVPIGLTRVVVDKDGISHYEITKNGKTVRVETEDIVHFTMPSPSHEYYGLSPLESVKTQLTINHYYGGHIRDFFKYGGIPAGVLRTEQQVDEAFAEETRQRWNRMYGGDKSMNQIAVLGKGISYEPVNPPLKDLVIETLNSMPRDAILAVCGLPPVLAGIYEYANYANSTQQIKIFW